MGARAKFGTATTSIITLRMQQRSSPGGLPIEVFDGLRESLAANGAQFYRDFPSGPFYGFNRPGAKAIEGVVDNWWRQGMCSPRMPT
jgi:non-heme chloroperoxidase